MVSRRPSRVRRTGDLSACLGEEGGQTRIHLDIWTDDLDAAVALVEDLGGRRLSEMGEDPEGVGFVMADPEGNEFCRVALRV